MPSAATEANCNNQEQHSDTYIKFGVYFGKFKIKVLMTICVVWSTQKIIIIYWQHLIYM